MAKKATHYGICQACGSRQKLPGDALSLHGYRVRNGWFEGACVGSGNLPFEVSKDLIESFIAAAEHLRDRFLARAAAHRAIEFGSLECWHRVYHPELSNRSRGSVYLWHEGRVQAKERGGLEFVYTSRDVEKRVDLHCYSHADATAQEKREAFAKSLDYDAEREVRYIKWQQRRIADWAPKPLTPIDPKARMPEAEDFDAALAKAKA